MGVPVGTVIFANQQRTAWYFRDNAGNPVTPPTNPSPIGYSAEDFAMIVLPSLNQLAIGFEDNGTYGDNGPGKILTLNLADYTLVNKTAFSSGTHLYDFDLGVCVCFNGTNLYGMTIIALGGGTYSHFLRKVNPSDLTITQSWDLTTWLTNAFLGNTLSTAVSPDGNTFYICKGDFSPANKDILRYDLLGNAPLSTWTTPASIQQGGDEGNGFLMLPDGTLLVISDIIRRYNTSGTVIQTYLDPPGTGGRSAGFGLTPGQTSATFWAGGTKSGLGYYFEINISTGAIVHEFEMDPAGYFPGHFAVIPGVDIIGGMYKIERDSFKSNDTEYTGSGNTTQDVKIPDPLIDTALIGDEQ